MSPLSPSQDGHVTRSHMMNPEPGHGSRMHFTHPEYPRGSRVQGSNSEHIHGSNIQDYNNEDSSSRLQERNHHSVYKQGNFIYLHN